MKYEALDRIHVIRTMLDNLLIGNFEEVNEGYHQGLSTEAKELVGKAIECLCDAYQKQGEFAFEEERNEATH